MEKEAWYKFDETINGLTSRKLFFRFYLWKYFFSFVFKVSPEICKRTRVVLLRLFGAEIGSGNYISSTCIIPKPWCLKMGNYNSIDSYAYFNGDVVIGNNVKIGSFVKIITSGHDVRSRNFSRKVVPSYLEDSCFIGANSVILKGVTVGTFSVIGANSFVLKSIPENSIAIGSPAKVIGNRIDPIEFEKYDYAKKP